MLCGQKKKKKKKKLYGKGRTGNHKGDLKDPELHRKLEGFRKAIDGGRGVLEALLKVCSVKIDETLIQSCKRGKDESVDDFRTGSHALSVSTEEQTAQQI